MGSPPSSMIRPPADCHFLPISSHVPLMVCKRSGENVAAVIVADEIQKIGPGRVECGKDGCGARIGDGPRRQSRIPVGVVRRIGLQIALKNRTDGAPGQARGIDHSGITLQRHSFGQPLGEHTGHEWAFIGGGRFFLHQRGECDYIVEFPGGSPGLLRDNFLDHLAESPDHCGHDRASGHPARKTIGIRKQIALERLRVGIKLPNFFHVFTGAKEILRTHTQVLMNNARDVEAVGAFGNDYGMQVNFAMNQSAIDIKRAQRVVEEIFTGLDGSPRPAQPITGEERPAVCENAALDKQIRGLATLHSSVDDEDLTSGETLIGTVQVPHHPTRGGERRGNEHKQDPLLHSPASLASRRWRSLT